MAVHIESGTSLQARKQRISLLFERIISRGELDLADEIFAEDFVWPQFDLHGPDGVRTWVRDFRSAFPDVLDTVEEQIGEGDVVITRARVIGTQTGEFRGLPASGRTADFMAVGIDRFRGEKVIERTALFDITDVMRQLGHTTLTLPAHS